MDNKEFIQTQREPRTWPKVAIIVLNWNGWKDTIECLESLQRSTYPNYQLIVVDNGSTDASTEKIEAWARGELTSKSKFFDYDPYSKPVCVIKYDKNVVENQGIENEESKFANLPPNRKLILIQTGKNLGFTGGNNIGINYALKNGADYIFILNNDTVVDPNALTKMVQVAMQSPKIGMVSPTVFDYYNPTFVDRLGITLTIAGLGYDRKKESDGPLLCPSGCAALYSRQMLLEISCDDKYFDEDFFSYCEELDLGIRAYLRGFAPAFASDATIYHKGGASSGGPGSAMSIYFEHRNKIWVIVKNFPTRILIKNAFWILICQIMGAIKRIGNPQFWVVMKGKIDAIKGLRKMWIKRKRLHTHNTYITLPLYPKPFILRSQKWIRR